MTTAGPANWGTDLYSVLLYVCIISLCESITLFRIFKSSRWNTENGRRDGRAIRTSSKMRTLKLIRKYWMWPQERLLMTFLGGSIEFSKNKCWKEETPFSFNGTFFSILFNVVCVYTLWIILVQYFFPYLCVCVCMHAFVYVCLCHDSSYSCNFFPIMKIFLVDYTFLHLPLNFYASTDFVSHSPKLCHQ